MPTLPQTKPRSLLFAVLVAMLSIALLTGCVTGSSEHRESLRIYQPRVLHLPAGLPIQTTAGTYIPQTAETWHSAQAYAELESQLINTAAALAQERNRTR